MQYTMTLQEFVDCYEAEDELVEKIYKAVRTGKKQVYGEKRFVGKGDEIYGDFTQEYERNVLFEIIPKDDCVIVEHYFSDVDRMEIPIPDHTDYVKIGEW